MSKAENMQAALRRWMRAWPDADGSCIPALFAQDAVYSECYGPEYHGRAQIARWFADWNADGRVLRWDCKRLLCADGTVIAEWYFECEHGGAHSAFDGVTLADFDENGQIVCLKEFQSDVSHTCPYET
ncbi:MAG: nuclear transport factor 2 family protein [Oscillospiraceae bacterium]|nr:nuclear transport factor 2 family protein [Oscillospiraceae bacterium]